MSATDNVRGRDAAFKEFDRSQDEHEQFTFFAGWSAAETLIRERDIRIAELERVVAAVQSVLPGPPTFAESLQRDFQGNPFPQIVFVDKLEAALAGAGDVLDKVKRDIAFDTIEDIRRDLSQPSVLWHGHGGVRVMVDQAWNKTIPLDEWLQDRADALDL